MRKYLYGIVAFVLAFAILSVTVLKCCSVISSAYSTYQPVSGPSLSPSPSPSPTPQVIYNLVYPGGILPGNLLWYFKALRDKIQYSITSDLLKKADLALLYSDKRLGASLTLFEDKEDGNALSTLQKGEKYLEISQEEESVAEKAGLNTNDFLVKLATASLKHRQIIEEQILPIAPENIKPGIVKSEDYSKNTYKYCVSLLSSKGIAAPKDPFNGQ